MTTYDDKMPIPSCPCCIENRIVEFLRLSTKQNLIDHK
jgi:hypothetical protein